MNWRAEMRKYKNMFKQIATQCRMKQKIIFIIDDKNGKCFRILISGASL